MAIAHPPTIRDNLSLAFFPGQLETFRGFADDRSTRVENLLGEGNVEGVMIGANLAQLIHEGPAAGLQERMAHFPRQLTVWRQMRDQAQTTKTMRNVFYGAVLLTGFLQKSYPVLSFITGTASVVFAGGIYYSAKTLEDARHLNETFLHQHLPANLHDPFFAPQQ